MNKSIQFAALLFALSIAALPAFAKPITNTTARVHSSQIHDRGTHAHEHQSLAHH